jgi:hypothetical protein
MSGEACITRMTVTSIQTDGQTDRQTLTGIVRGRYADELSASLEEAATISWGSGQKGVFTQIQALDFIGGKIKPSKFARRTQYNKADEAREKLATVVVSLVPVVRSVCASCRVCVCVCMFVCVLVRVCL